MIAFGWTIEYIERELSYEQIAMFSVVAAHEQHRAEERQAAQNYAMMQGAALGGGRI